MTYRHSPPVSGISTVASASGSVSFSFSSEGSSLSRTSSTAGPSVRTSRPIRLSENIMRLTTLVVPCSSRCALAKVRPSSVTSSVPSSSGRPWRPKLRAVSSAGRGSVPARSAGKATQYSGLLSPGAQKFAVPEP